MAGLLKRVAMWMLSGPFFIKTLLEKGTFAGDAADIYAATIPFWLLILNAYTVVTFTCDLERYDRLFAEAKKVWFLLFPLLFVTTGLFKRGVSWLSAQVAGDKEAAKRWSRRGLLSLFLYGLATFVSLIVAMALAMSRDRASGR